ncbi:MAG: hypothetical protein AB8B73_07110 [Ekhidna sp.]
MKKWLILSSIVVILILSEYFLSETIPFHEAFRVMVIFFATQAFVLFRIDHWTLKEWAVQISLVKITIRLLSSMTFILVLIYSYEDSFNLVLQFIILYLIFMVFEIAEALTNLRRN